MRNEQISIFAGLDVEGWENIEWILLTSQICSSGVNVINVKMFGIIEHMIYWDSIAWPISATQCTDFIQREPIEKHSINHDNLQQRLLNHVITKLNLKNKTIKIYSDKYTYTSYIPSFQI